LIGILVVILLRADDFLFVTLPITGEWVVHSRIDRHRCFPKVFRSTGCFRQQALHRLMVHVPDRLDGELLADVIAVDVPEWRQFSRRFSDEAPRAFVGTEIFTQPEIRLEFPERVFGNRRLLGAVERERRKDALLRLGS
jgi:hypothetical protein